MAEYDIDDFYPDSGWWAEMADEDSRLEFIEKEMEYDVAVEEDRIVEEEYAEPDPDVAYDRAREDRLFEAERQYRLFGI